VRTLWHCIIRGLVGAAHSSVPDGSFGRFCGDAAATAGNCPLAAADGPVAATAGLAFASPGNVRAATVRHAPAVAYNLKRKENSPGPGRRVAAREPGATADRQKKRPSLTPGRPITAEFSHPRHK
jgi:hypothetical protein